MLRVSRNCGKSPGIAASRTHDNPARLRWQALDAERTEKEKDSLRQKHARAQETKNISQTDHADRKLRDNN
jgi:hypothetical protein